MNNAEKIHFDSLVDKIDAKLKHGEFLLQFIEMHRDAGDMAAVERSLRKFNKNEADVRSFFEGLAAMNNRLANRAISAARDLQAARMAARDAA